MPEFGQCSLCRTVAELQLSHLLPKGAYRRLRQRSSGPVFFDGQIAIQASDQVAQYLLCAKCEGRFSGSGEDWFLRNCFDGQAFPLRERLLSSTPIGSAPGFRAYAARGIPDLDADKLAYFGLSVFWRSAATAWSRRGRSIPAIDLSPQEGIRRFLIGQQSVPSNVAMMVSVSTLESPLFGLLPVRVEADSRNSGSIHHFALLGVSFVLFAGTWTALDKESICLARSRNGVVTVSQDLTEIVHSLVVRLARQSEVKGAALSRSRIG